MPDWTGRLHRAFAASGHACEGDVLEELSTHAATAYEALLAEGCDPHEAERRVGDLMDVWVREASDAVSCLVPARRAAKVDPLTALRAG